MTAVALKNSISADLEEAVNSIFLKYQDRLGITVGDIEPLVSLYIDRHQESLSDLIYTALEFQADTCNVSDDFYSYHAD